MAGIFLSTETRYGTFFAAQNRSAAKLIELPKGAGAPVFPHVMTQPEWERKTAELDRALKEANDMAAATFGQPTRGGRVPGGGRSQLLLLFRMNQIGLLEAELGSFDDNGRMRPLAMGVLDQPTHRGENQAGQVEISTIPQKGPNSLKGTN